MTSPIDNIQQEFLAEANELVEALSRDLLLLDEARKSDERMDPSLLNEIFRSAHTLKGISGMFGYKDVGVVAHALEDLLDDLRLGRTQLSQDLLDILFDSVELFQQLISAGPDGHPAAAAAYVELVQQVGQQGAALSGDSLESYELDASVLSVLTEYEEHRLRACLREGMALFRLRARFDLASIDSEIESLKESAQSDAEIITYLPSMDGGDLDSLELVIILASRLSLDGLQERFGQQFGLVEPIERRSLKPSRPPALPDSIVPRNTDAASLAPTPSGEPGALASVAHSLRVDIRKLDHLMNVVGELSLVRNAIAHLFDRLKGGPGRKLSATELDQLGRQFERQLTELRSGILDVRMVPLRQVFTKLARVARKVSREHEKSVRLVVTGAETEVDKLIVEELTDPLMHLVRNAIDHGIETPKVRERAGKDAEGTLAINAYHKGSNVVIEIEDDGAGMDPRALRDTAIRRGLITREDGQDMTDQDLLNLVFLPGLTTTTEITATSGRGVGMDVVKTNILKLGGVIGIESEQGIGTKITVTLPITLAIIRALLIKIAERVFALPINTVSEVLAYRAADVRTIQGRRVVSLRGETLPLLYLRALFGFDDSVEHVPHYVVVVEVGERRLGFVVQGLEEQRDVIIKSLGKSLRSVRGLAGATDLGDERVALVLDAPALVQEYFDGVRPIVLAAELPS